MPPQTRPPGHKPRRELLYGRYVRESCRCQGRRFRGTDFDLSIKGGGEVCPTPSYVRNCGRHTQSHLHRPPPVIQKPDTSHGVTSHKVTGHRENFSAKGTYGEASDVRAGASGDRLRSRGGHSRFIDKGRRGRVSPHAQKTRPLREGIRARCDPCGELSPQDTSHQDTSHQDTSHQDTSHQDTSHQDTSPQDTSPGENFSTEGTYGRTIDIGVGAFGGRSSVYR